MKILLVKIVPLVVLVALYCAFPIFPPVHFGEPAAIAAPPAEVVVSSAEPGPSPDWPISSDTYWQHHEQLTNFFIAANLSNSDKGRWTYKASVDDAFNAATDSMKRHGLFINDATPAAKRQTSGVPLPVLGGVR
jgi:hypothetical protein